MYVQFLYTQVYMHYSIEFKHKIIEGQTKILRMGQPKLDIHDVVRTNL